MHNLSITEYCKKYSTGIVEKLELCIKIAVKLDELNKEKRKNFS